MTAFGANGQHQDARFEALDASGQTVEGVAFVGCAFARCALLETRFVACRFERCAFGDGELSAVRFDDCTLLGVDFARCKLLGVDWTRAKTSFRPLEVAFSRCALDGGVFEGLDLRAVRFADCRAHRVEFGGANLSGVAFARTDLAGATFSETNLTGADFRTAKNYALHLARNAVEGAKFSFPEAVTLLAPFGVEVDFGEGGRF